MWYIGGEEAEDGVERDEKLQTATMLDELKTLLPWQSLQGARYKTVLLINRIYPLERRLLSAAKAHVQFIGNNGVNLAYALNSRPQCCTSGVKALATTQGTTATSTTQCLAFT
jgi:hypothetical protein